jgi:hypothetical protein
VHIIFKQNKTILKKYGKKIIDILSELYINFGSKIERKNIAIL